MGMLYIPFTIYTLHGVGLKNGYLVSEVSNFAKKG